MEETKGRTGEHIRLTGRLDRYAKTSVDSDMGSPPRKQGKKEEIKKKTKKEKKKDMVYPYVICARLSKSGRNHRHMPPGHPSLRVDYRRHI